MSSESKSRVVYENLDTTFVNLWALLRKLTQRGFIGRVHVELKDYTADVFMTGTSKPLVREIDRAAGTETTEEAALHRLVLRVRETPGTISVFEGAAETMAVQGANLQPESSESVVANDPPVVQSEAKDAVEDETPYSHSQVSSGKDRAPSAPVTDYDDDITETSRSSVQALAPSPLPTAEPIDDLEWAAVLKTSGELVAGVERALNGAGADFNSLFNRARLDLADDYTFLDPMSGQFTYANSVVTLNVDAPGSAYVIGLSETLRRVVDAVATGDRARRVRERVALELLSVARKRREILDRSGFLAQLDRIAGTTVL
jgi:hypothetical protein